MTETTFFEMTLLNVLPRFIQERYQRAKDSRIEADWVGRGRPVPPPHVIKRRRIEWAAQRFGLSILVETGTYKGDLIHAVRQDFVRIYSIELDERLHQRAVRRFAKQPHIRLVHGDSGEMLSKVLAEAEGPSVFWLDAHFSGGITKKGDQETPILAELQALSGRCPADVILIDDARCFNGRHDFPTLEVVRSIVGRLFPKHSFSVSDDIISILPNTGAMQPLS
jgi:hypothetical protein